MSWCRINSWSFAECKKNLRDSTRVSKDLFKINKRQSSVWKWQKFGQGSLRGRATETEGKTDTGRSLAGQSPMGTAAPIEGIRGEARW